MLGIRAFVSIGSAVIGASLALTVLLAVNRWFDVEVPGQVAVSMAVFALVRDLAADCLDRFTMHISARHVRQLLDAHLADCLKRTAKPIPWSRLHHAVERLVRLPSHHRLHAQHCLNELESYSAYRAYGDILSSFDMSKTRSLIDALGAGK